MIVSELLSLFKAVARYTAHPMSCFRPGYANTRAFLCSIEMLQFDDEIR